MFEKAEEVKRVMKECSVGEVTNEFDLYNHYKLMDKPPSIEIGARYDRGGRFQLLLFVLCFRDSRESKNLELQRLNATSEVQLR